MARLPILLLLAALGPALAAQTSLTVDQFEKSLTALHAMHDKQAARELVGMKLTERASPERAAHWQAEMPGKLASEALMALVDASGFLDPPQEEAPTTAPPTMDAQKEILARAADQVEAILHKLPNFYAKRTTSHFETATPPQLHAQQETMAIRQPDDTLLVPLLPVKPKKLPHTELGPVDRAKPELGLLFYITDEEQTVTYSNGSEVESAKSGWQGADLGLATRGEFGPILKMALEDALQRGLSWSHWEQGVSGPLAVFRYDVPKESSHYEIVSREGKPPYFPAYHGELGIDPSTGAILRITVESSGPEQSFSVDQPEDLVDSAILVEYGPVAIGGRTYNCPVHAVARSTTRSIDMATGKPGGQQPEFLNDVTFTGYHLIRAEVRILPQM
jgi:hypothetical protein